MITDPNYPARLTDVASVYAMGRNLVEYASALDVIVTIDLVPQRPLAMGNYAASIKAWPRKVSAVSLSLGTPLDVGGIKIIPERTLTAAELRALLESRPGTIVPMDESIGYISIPYGLHPATAQLVQRFATALAMKLRQAERKHGYSDHWQSPDWMDECRADLWQHWDKGDPRDVAAYCAFLWHHGEKTAAPAPSPQDQSPKQPITWQPITWQRDDNSIRLMLLCVGIDADLATVASWSSADAEAAAEWAAATHFSASDNDDVVVPPRPSFLPQPWKGPEGDPHDIMTAGPSATPVTP
nr:hypothetical protein [uncultured Roseateles sp.]